jgi:hypothetical protein
LEEAKKQILKDLGYEGDSMVVICIIKGTADELYWLKCGWESLGQNTCNI